MEEYFASATLLIGALLSYDAVRDLEILAQGNEAFATMISLSLIGLSIFTLLYGGQDI